VAEVLDLPEVREGRPTVVAGHAGLQARVRWVHVSEVPDIAHLLRGGELILTTGIALPEAPGGLERYVRDLAAAGAVGVVVELVRRFSELPVEMVRAADGAGLPLVVLHREVRFVAITEAVHSRIVNARVSDLAAEERIHRELQALALESGSVEQIVERMAELAHCPVVVENLAHQPVVFATAGQAPEAVLAGWSARSRRESGTGQGWASVPLGARGQVWGRVVLLPEATATVCQRAVLEDGATALAVARLLERQPLPLEHAARRTLLGELVERRLRSAEELHVRAEALGVPTRDRRLRAVVVRLASGNPEQEALAALAATGVLGLAGRLPSGSAGILVTTKPGEVTLDAVETLAEAMAAALGNGGTVGAAAADSTAEVDVLARAFAEAEEAARAGTPSAGRHFATVADIRLAGLLRLLADDGRLQRFVEAELGALLDHDERHGTQLFELVATYVRSGGNKSVAALRSHLSRAAFYQHLQRAGEILGRDLEDPEVRTSLHVAILAAEAGVLGTSPPGASPTPGQGLRGPARPAQRRAAVRL
jgi:purine catabolism regulator